MCIFKNKWKDFEPTTKYLSVVGGLTSVTKLHNYLKQFKWQGEKGDHWKTPWEFIENKDNNNDCEDFARLAVDVLVRIIGIKEARFIAYYAGLKGHAICAFPYRGKYSVFSNNELLHGFTDYIGIGHKFFPKGFRSMVVRDWQGKIIKKTRKWIGTF